MGEQQHISIKNRNWTLHEPGPPGQDRGRVKERGKGHAVLSFLSAQRDSHVEGRTGQCVGRDRCQAGEQTQILRESQPQSSAGKLLADPAPHSSNQISKLSSVHGL